MSQRKEKYLRSALNQYEGISGEVKYLKEKADSLDEKLNMTLCEQEKLKSIFAGERRRRERERSRRRERKKRNAIRIGITVAAAVVLGASMTWAMTKQEHTGDLGKDGIREAQELSLVIEKSGESEPGYCDEIPLTVDEQRELIEAADAFDIWYPLAVAMVDVETSFQNIAGDGGASIGYLQVNGTLHTALMEQVGATDLWVPRDNFRTGLAYLAQQLERTDTVHKALMAYNMGPSGAAAAWKEGVYETEYSQKVVERAEYWAAVMGW